MNRPGYRFFVVNVQTISIDSGWENISDANDRAVALREETGAAVKVMTKPRIGFGATETRLDPNDEASWSPKRRANPREPSDPGARKSRRLSVGSIPADPGVMQDIETAKAQVERDENGPFVVDYMSRDGWVEWRRAETSERARKFADAKAKTQKVQTRVRRYGSAWGARSTQRANPSAVWTVKDAKRAQHDATSFRMIAEPERGEWLIDKVAEDGTVSISCADDHPDAVRGDRLSIRVSLAMLGNKFEVVTEDARARRNPSLPERGSYWRKKATDRHNRVYQVEACSGRVDPADPNLGTIEGSYVVSIRDVVTGEAFRSSLATFLDVFTPGDATTNPSQRNRRQQKFFGSEQDAWDYFNDLDDKEKFQIVYRHVHDDFVVELKDPDIGRHVRSAEVQSPRENPDGGPDSARAEALFETWHKKQPHNVDIKKIGVKTSAPMVCVGQAFDITYLSGKWEKGSKKNLYVHTFDSKPKVWMLASVVGSEDGRGAKKTVEEMLARCCNADGQLAVADLASPESFSLGSGEEDIAIHRGAKVYGATDQKTVIIFDPRWKIIVVRGGSMYFDERGIVN